MKIQDLVDNRRVFNLGSISCFIIDLEPQITGFSVESETTCIGRAENIQDWKVDYGLTSYGFADCSEGLDGWVKMDLFSNKYVTYVKILAPPDGR